MTEGEKAFVREIGRQRYESKRNAGIPANRRDGSRCSAENDIEATGAEYFATKHYGRPFDARITTRGDGGFDFVIELRVEVVWLGAKPDGSPRDTGHLIIDPAEPQRWSDIYVLIAGSVETGFRIAGWTTHRKLTSKPKKDFGYGERFAMHIDDLQKTDLRVMKRPDVNQTTRAA